MPSGLPPNPAFVGNPRSERAVSPELPARRLPLAFTLIELLAVMVIVIILLALIVPAFTGIGTARNLTKGAYDIAGLLDEARAYAKANSTYTWVGFFEEAEGGAAGTAGVGRVVVSVVASKDGTSIYTPAPPDPGATLTATKLLQIGTLVKIDNVHLTDLTASQIPSRGQVTDPSSSPAPVATTYLVGDSNFNSHNGTANLTTFYYPLGTTASNATYTFVKIIQFNPLGDATKIVDTPTQLMEADLVATHGTVQTANAVNCAAIQITGIGGQVRIYRP